MRLCQHDILPYRADIFQRSVHQPEVRAASDAGFRVTLVLGIVQLASIALSRKGLTQRVKLLSKGHLQCILFWLLHK